MRALANSRRGAPAGARGVTLRDPLELESGAVLEGVEIAFEQVGALSPGRDNAVLVCHALTGDSHVTATEADPAAGWWESIVGPGRAIDTDRWSVISANWVGGCYGSTGPLSIDPSTGDAWLGSFPPVTVGDQVEAQARLLAQLGIERLAAVVGGSLGGMVALEWAARRPHSVERVAAIASGARLGAQGLAWSAVQRGAIRADPEWADGRYALGPRDGLRLARQLAHVSYRSPQSLAARFGRRLGEQLDPLRDEVAFELERYLEHKGTAFVERFDATTYLRLSRAMDSWSLGSHRGAARALEPFEGSLFAASFSSDQLFPPPDARALAHAAHAAGVRHELHELRSDEGHDAFLLPHRALARALANFIEDAEREPATATHDDRRDV